MWYPELRMHFCCLDIHDMGNFQDQAVSVSRKCFYFGAIWQLLLSWCWQENIFPLEDNPIAFPTCCCYWLLFAPASWLHISSLGVSAALSLDIASSCFAAVCPFDCYSWSPIILKLLPSYPTAMWSLLIPSPGSLQTWLPLLLLLRGFQTLLPCWLC